MNPNGDLFVFRSVPDWGVTYNGKPVGKIVVNDYGKFYFVSPTLTSVLYSKFADLKADLPDMLK